jgi:predicted kinase
MSTLIVLGGLPASGKTTIARLLARRLGASHLRIDTIEQALLGTGEALEVTTAGYVIGYAVARDCLLAGATVIADSVNSIAITRDMWRQTGLDAGGLVLEIEVVCSDQDEHRRRIANRQADIEGHRQPNWRDVANRDYHPWPEAALTIDTASTSADLAVERVVALLDI